LCWDFKLHRLRDKHERRLPMVHPSDRPVGYLQSEVRYQLDWHCEDHFVQRAVWDVSSLCRPQLYHVQSRDWLRLAGGERAWHLHVRAMCDHGHSGGWKDFDGDVPGDVPALLVHGLHRPDCVQMVHRKLCAERRLRSINRLQLVSFLHSPDHRRNLPGLQG